MRRKGVGTTVVKSWIVVSKTGHAHLEDVGKHSIMRRTGLPARDLRVLDPVLSHPSSILGREKAIVVNLEHVKAIITAAEVLLINSSNPYFLAFHQDLLTRLSIQFSPPVGKDMDDYGAKPLEMESAEDLGSGSPVKKLKDSGSPKMSAEIVTGEEAPKQIPFEFRVLEACIESACRCHESETSTLEKEAYPALDELTSKVSTLNLERVRQIKSRLVALSGRVQKIADELEHLLDDDNDMAEMYLTEKLDSRLWDQTSYKEGHESEIEDDDQSDQYSGKFEPKLDVEELEMLLEAYFAETNGILQRLSSLSEYVDDTEDYINIMLDDKQNELLQAAILFDTVNMILNVAIVIVGLFGMNIHIELYDGIPHQFWTIVFGTCAGCIFLFLACLWWGKKRYSLSQ